MEYEDLNVVDDTQENVVDSQTEAEVTSEVTEPTETVEEVVEDSQPRQQTAEENSRFAEMRRKFEAEQQSIQAQNDRLLQALSQYGYDGSPEEIADALMAQTQGISVEEAREERERAEHENAESLKMQNELEFYRNIATEKLMADDLAKVKAIYPEVKDFNSLGDDFFKALQATQDPVMSYEIVKAKQARETKPVPPEIGGVNNSSSKEKDYYTPQEVDNLTDKDYNNPKIMEIVRKSMLKWR